MNILQWLLPMISAPATLIILRFINAFNVRPLAIWSMPASALTVVIAIGGAWMARFTDRNISKKSRRKRFSIGMGGLLTCGFVYDFQFNNPPFEGWILLYDIVAYITYFGTHLFYGFCVAEIASMLIEPEEKKASAKAT